VAKKSQELRKGEFKDICQATFAAAKQQKLVPKPKQEAKDKEDGVLFQPVKASSAAAGRAQLAEKDEAELGDLDSEDEWMYSAPLLQPKKKQKKEGQVEEGVGAEGSTAKEVKAKPATRRRPASLGAAGASGAASAQGSEKKSKVSAVMGTPKDKSKLGIAQYQAVIAAENLRRDAETHMNVLSNGEKMMTITDGSFKTWLDKLAKKLLKESVQVLAGLHENFEMTDAQGGENITANQLHDRGMEAISGLQNVQKTFVGLAETVKIYNDILKPVEKQKRSSTGPTEEVQADLPEMKYRISRDKLAHLLSAVGELAKTSFKIPSCLHIKTTRVCIDVAWDGRRLVKTAKLCSTSHIDADDSFEEIDVKLALFARKDLYTNIGEFKEEQKSLILGKWGDCFRDDEDTSRIGEFTSALLGPQVEIMDTQLKTETTHISNLAPLDADMDVQKADEALKYFQNTGDGKALTYRSMWVLGIGQKMMEHASQQVEKAVVDGEFSSQIPSFKYMLVQNTNGGISMRTVAEINDVAKKYGPKAMEFQNHMRLCSGKLKKQYAEDLGVIQDGLADLALRAVVAKMDLWYGQLCKAFASMCEKAFQDNLQNPSAARSYLKTAFSNPSGKYSEALLALTDLKDLCIEQKESHDEGITLVLKFKTCLLDSAEKFFYKGQWHISQKEHKEALTSDAFSNFVHYVTHLSKSTAPPTPAAPPPSGTAAGESSEASTTPPASACSTAVDASAAPTGATQKMKPPKSPEKKRKGAVAATADAATPYVALTEETASRFLLNGMQKMYISSGMVIDLHRAVSGVHYLCKTQIVNMIGEMFYTDDSSSSLAGSRAISTYVLSFKLSC